MKQQKKWKKLKGNRDNKQQFKTSEDDLTSMKQEKKA
jgi:hypothetical protein